jgi:subtilisin family serine protease/photosystem II stability/assembly factor-like uncharacterized protein
MKHRFSKASSLVLGSVMLAVVPFLVSWSAGPGSGRAKTSQSRSQTNTSPRVVPGVIVIKLKSGALPPSAGLLKGDAQQNQLLRAAGVLTFRKAFPASRPLSLNKSNSGMVDVSRIYFASIGGGQDPVEVAKRLDHSGEFEYVEPKYMSHTFDTPNDIDYAAQQALYFNQMNAPAGWAITKGDSNVVIADVDGGTDWQHPDLQANLWINKAEDTNGDGKFEPTASTSGGDDNGVDNDNNGFVDDVIGWNFTNNSNNPIGSLAFNYTHGTATASHFGAVTNNTIGMAGSSWNCRIMPICASSAQSDGDIEFGYEGIQYAYANGAKVINCSWGRTGAASRFEQDVINAAAQAGALVVAAAGNDASISDYVPQYPANYRNVLGVGAVTSGVDILAPFSNYGLTVPVYAPGTDIWGAMTDGSTADAGSGTSYASPLTAGLAGLVKSLHPTWTPQEIATQIRMTSDSIGPILGHGRINFGRALTETHAGLEILSSSLLTPRGGKLFLPGDTVVLNVTVRNILFASATNLSFFATASDPVLRPLQGSTGTVTLAAGDSLVLPPLLFTVDTMSASKAVLVRLDWTDFSPSGNEHDAYAYRVNVFPTAPQWEEVQSPTFNGLFSVSAVDRNVLWTAGGDGNATSPVVLRSQDGGATWTDVTGNLSGADLYCINAIDSSRAWVGTGDGRIFATTNGGTSWSQQTYPAPQSPFIDAIKIFPDLSGFALGDPAGGGTFVILHTTDGGSSWTHIASEPTGLADEAGWNNSFCWTDKKHGWFGTNKNRIWGTTNGGVSWFSGTTPEAGSVAISFEDSLNGMAGFPDGGLSVTVDGGSTWSSLTSPTTQAITSISYIPGTTYAWIADYATPYLSTNRGSSWIPQTTFPFSGSIYHGAFVDTSAGWMVTSFGEVLLYNGTVPTFTAPTESQQPTSFALEQNYPNPFNPSTTIRFRVPSRSRVKLTIYNMLGQQIAEVANKEFDAGSYEQVWSGTVASGIYFYRIEATPDGNPGKKFVDVKKMVLIK